MEFIIRNQSLQMFFQECAREFTNACPALANTLRHHTRELSGLLHSPDGMSKDGNFMLIGCMPQFMYAFIKRQAAKRLGIDDVWRDPKNLKLFLREWETCQVKRKPKQRFALTSPSRP